MPADKSVVRNRTRSFHLVLQKKRTVDYGVLAFNEAIMNMEMGALPGCCPNSPDGGIVGLFETTVAEEVSPNERIALSVLVLTEDSETASCLEHAVVQLGHKIEWHDSRSPEAIETHLTSTPWDVVVIECARATGDCKFQIIDRASLKLRLLLNEGDRVAFIAAGRPGSTVCRDAEWLVHALGRIVWRFC